MLVYIKSKEEIEGFKEAGRIAGKILNTLLENVKVGITTIDLDNIALAECEKYKVIPTFLDYDGFPAAICASVNNTLVHGIPTDIPLKQFDIISIDMGVTLDGFIGDTADTVEVGGNSVEHRNLIAACRSSLAMAMREAKAGCKLSKISAAIQNVARRNKYSIPVEYGGHGIDRNILHSDPFVPNIIGHEENVRLRPGMIFAIEPMFIMGRPKIIIAKNGWDIVAETHTAHCEHTILITDGDPLILTQRSKNV